jgi:hypothetical protein
MEYKNHHPWFQFLGAERATSFMRPVLCIHNIRPILCTYNNYKRKQWNQAPSVRCPLHSSHADACHIMRQARLPTNQGGGGECTQISGWKCRVIFAQKENVDSWWCSVILVATNQKLCHVNLVTYYYTTHKTVKHSSTRIFMENDT